MPTFSYKNSPVQIFCLVETLTKDFSYITTELAPESAVACSVLSPLPSTERSLIEVVKITQTLQLYGQTLTRLNARYNSSPTLGIYFPTLSTKRSNFIFVFSNSRVKAPHMKVYWVKVHAHA